jgi:hypothetical protein
MTQCFFNDIACDREILIKKANPVGVKFARLRERDLYNVMKTYGGVEV